MTSCIRCQTALTPDDANADTDYQFDNALWVGLYGGYGMFVDNLEARLPNNSEDRWQRNEDGQYLTAIAEGRQVPVENPGWEPTYNEERTLPGRPDYEAVLCHDCAHELCDREPWLAKLINPHGSHAHRTAYHEAHPDHDGWDYRT